MADNGEELHGSEALLRGLLAIVVDWREAQLNPDDRRTEVLLSEAGLPNSMIAAVMGKSADAVRMAISRARKA